MKEGYNNKVKWNFENPNFSNELAQKYELLAKAAEIYTENELEIIDSLQTLNVAWSPLWCPLEMEDKKTGEFSGYIRSIFDEISRITGIKFNYVKCKTTKFLEYYIGGKSRQCWLWWWVFRYNT